LPLCTGAQNDDVYSAWWFSIGRTRVTYLIPVFFHSRIRQGRCRYSTEDAGNIEIGPMLQTSVIDMQGHRRNLFLLQVPWSTNFDIFR
jgi:hypothetical protein